MPLFNLDKKTNTAAVQRVMKEILRVFSTFVQQYNEQVEEHALRLKVDEHRPAPNVERTLISNSYYVLSFSSEKNWIKAHLFRTSNLLRAMRQETQMNLKLALQVNSKDGADEIQLENEERVNEEIDVILLSVFEELVRKSQLAASFDRRPRVELNGRSVATAVRHLINERNNALTDLLKQNEQIHNALAREIHDQVISELMLVKQALEQREELAEQAGSVEDAINYLRDICSGLSSREIQDWGLIPCLKNLVQKFRRKAEFDIKLIVPESPQPPLPLEVNVQAFRIMQEALNNAIKHSSGDSITITVEHDASVMRLSVSDNGTSSPVTYTRDGGMGSFILNERVAIINEIAPAELAVRRSESGGTTVELRIQL